jgi:hypothetical protein
MQLTGEVERAVAMEIPQGEGDGAVGLTVAVTPATRRPACTRNFCQKMSYDTDETPGFFHLQR